MQAEIAVGGRTVMILSVFSFQGRRREGRREDRGARFDDEVLPLDHESHICVRQLLPSCLSCIHSSFCFK